MSENATTVSEGSHVGDWLSIEMPVRRKWWQFWKPRYHFPRQSYQINAVSNSTVELDGSREADGLFRRVFDLLRGAR